MDPCLEWFRNFLLHHSVIKNNSIFLNKINSSIFGSLSAMRFKLLNPGTAPFVDHTFYSIFISLNDSNYFFKFDDSNEINFSKIRAFLLHYLSDVDFSLNDLSNSNQTFTNSHLKLIKSLMKYYICFNVSPSTISPTCFGKDINSYEAAFVDWGRSICSNEIKYQPPSFMIDYGTGQIPAVILSKMKPELVRLNYINFFSNINVNFTGVSKNWREIEPCLNVLDIRAPNEKERRDKLCMLCFATDLFKKVYNNFNQNLNQQTSDNKSNYIKENPMNRVDYLLNQMNAISNGNSNIFLVSNNSHNPLVVQQNINDLQYHNINNFNQQSYFHSNIQKPLDLMYTSSNEIKHNNTNNYEKHPSMNPFDFKYYNQNQNQMRIKIQSTSSPRKHISKRIENQDSYNKYNDLYKNPQNVPPVQSTSKHKHKRKLAHDEYDENEFKQFDAKKFQELKKLKYNRNKSKIKEKNNVKSISSFSIDPEFPNQSIKTTAKYLNNQNSDYRKSSHKSNVNKQNISQYKCSYITSDDFENHKQDIPKTISKINKPVFSKNSIFDDIISIDNEEKYDIYQPKTSDDFAKMLKNDQFLAFYIKKEDNLTSDDLNKIKKYIKRKKEAIKAASLVKHSKTKKNIEPPQDFSHLDFTKLETLNVLSVDPITEITMKQEKEKSKIKAELPNNNPNSEVKTEIIPKTSQTHQKVEHKTNKLELNNFQKNELIKEDSISGENETKLDPFDSSNSNIKSFEKPNQSQILSLDPFESSSLITTITKSNTSNNGNSDHKSFNSLRNKQETNEVSSLTSPPTSHKQIFKTDCNNSQNEIINFQNNIDNISNSQANEANSSKALKDSNDIAVKNTYNSNRNKDELEKEKRNKNENNAIQEPSGVSPELSIDISQSSKQNSSSLTKLQYSNLNTEISNGKVSKTQNEFKNDLSFSEFHQNTEPTFENLLYQEESRKNISQSQTLNQNSLEDNLGNNELSIIQDESEISHSNEDTNKKSNSEIQNTNSFQRSNHSVSSGTVESKINEFIPEYEKMLSNDSKSSHSNQKLQAQELNSKNSNPSSSSSDSSIPFKVLNSDSDNNNENISPNNEDNMKKYYDNQIIKDNISKSNTKTTSEIEFFDISSLKPKRKVVPLVSSTSNPLLSNSKLNDRKAISGPIRLDKEPIPKETNGKGPMSETRRVSFAIDMQAFASTRASQASSRNSKKNLKSTSGTSYFSDIDTYISSSSINQSISIPVENRLEAYARQHAELSLSMPSSEIEPAIVREYRDVSSANVNKNFLWLSDDENVVLENILPIIASAIEPQDIKIRIAQEVGLPKNNSSVSRIASNIINFLRFRKS